MNLLKYLIEYIGTFIFLSVILISGHAIPIGLALMVVIYWGGKVSGGNFNPAVSLMMYINKKLSLNDLIIYIIVQLLGGITALIFYKETNKLTNNNIHYHKKLS